MPADPWAVVTYPNGTTETVHCTLDDDKYTIGLPVFWVGQAYRVELHADNEPESWKNSIGMQIPGMAFNSETGVLSGTPTESVNGYWAMHASNAAGNSKTLWLRFLVLTEDEKPAITAETLPAGVVGAEYSEMIGLSGFVGSTREWSISSGTLPDGLTLSASGTMGWLHGTPTAAGSYTFAVRMENAAGVAEKQYTVVILSELMTPQIINGPR